MSAPKTIKFTYNWNNKLDCRAFTTLRKANERYWKIGETYKVYIKDGKSCRFIGSAMLKAKRSFHLNKINNFVSYLDTGYSVAKTIDIIQKMCNQPNPPLDYLLFVYVADQKQ